MQKMVLHVKRICGASLHSLIAGGLGVLKVKAIVNNQHGNLSVDFISKCLVFLWTKAIIFTLTIAKWQFFIFWLFFFLILKHSHLNMWHFYKMNCKHILIIPAHFSPSNIATFFLALLQMYPHIIFTCKMSRFFSLKKVRSHFDDQMFLSWMILPWSLAYFRVILVVAILRSFSVPRIYITFVGNVREQKFYSSLKKKVLNAYLHANNKNILHIESRCVPSKRE